MSKPQIQEKHNIYGKIAIAMYKECARTLLGGSLHA